MPKLLAYGVITNPARGGMLVLITAQAPITQGGTITQHEVLTTLILERKGMQACTKVTGVGNIGSTHNHNETLTKT